MSEDATGGVGAGGQNVPAGQGKGAQDRLKMFAPPDPMPESEKARTIQEYEDSFADVIHECDDTPTDAKRVHFLDPEKGRDLNPEERATARVRAIETSIGQRLSEEDVGSILDYAMTNDGMVERLREWAQGRDEVPTVFLNQLLERLQTVTYDAVIEEARLRDVMRRDHDQMQTRLDQCEETCAKEREDVKVAARTQLTTVHIKNIVTRMNSVARAQDSIMRDESPAPGEDEASAKMANEKAAAEWKEAYDEVVRAVTERQRSDDAVDGATEDETLAKLNVLRDADEQLEIAIDKLRDLARTRHRDYLLQARGRGSPKQHQLEQKHAQLLQDQQSLKELWQSLVTLASQRESTRAERREMKRQQSRPTETQVQSFVQSRKLVETKRECARLKRQLSERELQVAMLEKTIGGFRNDDIEAAVKSVRIYRGLVEAELRNRWYDKAGRLDSHFKTAGRLNRSFEGIRQTLDALDPDSGIEHDLKELQTKTARISTGLVGVTSGIGQLVAEFQDLGHLIHDDGRKLWNEADSRATTAVKDRQIAELERKVERLEARGLGISDSEGIRKVLESESGQRERSNQLADRYEKTMLELQNKQQQLEAEQRDKESLEEHVHSLQAMLGQPSELTEELERHRRRCLDEEQRANDAEDRVEGLKKTLEELSTQLLELRAAKAAMTGGEEIRYGQALEVPAADVELIKELQNKDKQIRMMTNNQAESEKTLREKLRVLQEEIRRLMKANKMGKERESKLEAELADCEDELSELKVKALSWHTAAPADVDEVTLKQRVHEEFGINLDEAVENLEDAKARWKELYSEWESCCQERDGLQEELVEVKEALARQEKLCTDLLGGNGGLRRELMETDRSRDRLRSLETDELERYKRIVAATKDHVDRILDRRARGEDGIEGIWRPGERKTVPDVLEIFSQQKSTEAYEDDEGNVRQLSTNEMNAYWKLLRFLELRRYVTWALEQRDFGRMRSQLDRLERWFTDSGNWHEYYTRSSIEVCLAYLWATLHVLEAQEMYLQRLPDWDRSADMARDRLKEGEELEEQDAAEMGTQNNAEPLVVSLKGWLDEQLKTVFNKRHEFLLPSKPSCACRVRPAFCRMHRDPSARKNTRFYHLAQVKGARADLLFQEPVAKDLEPFNAAI
ncbi:hypothetical protein SODALDRAFT_328999 [Sodiomyces alkalinus F11]|uniref:Uncharacterized protein n=1 Tax=Sodiomyces alkalinus (strain CBS 110278 / VKM F-3762 / F11) TaxID=1314773 RepID=A0A3N2PM74_SODAK|nr:hypothetical protein SODALDRAFT_328999 [Sodiomyces alkalinus F11]ROT35631.1 hypothetical protein SODALDRAFT_328999 [Sodiomyces alkalinus F11]